ncbi:hypothetical protein GP310_004751 [Salmonella enterica]|nr:hypothetical protein [Salmonella enterica subsp. enterica serovar Schwarzengrund]
MRPGWLSVPAAVFDMYFSFKSSMTVIGVCEFTFHLLQGTGRPPPRF